MSVVVFLMISTIRRASAVNQNTGPLKIFKTVLAMELFFCCHVTCWWVQLTYIRLSWCVVVIKHLGELVQWLERCQIRKWQWQSLGWVDTGGPSLNRQTCAVWFRTDRNAGSIPALAIIFPFSCCFGCRIDFCQRSWDCGTVLCSLCIIMWSILTVLETSLTIYANAKLNSSRCGLRKRALSKSCNALIYSSTVISQTLSC